MLNRKSFLGFLIDFEKKTLVSWLISKEFFGFLVDFQRTFRFFVLFRENFWCLGAPFRSFENDTATPFKTIRLHLRGSNIFYPSSDDEYGGPCHCESYSSSVHAHRYRWEHHPHHPYRNFLEISAS